jgi:hypothetical protein
VKQTKEVLWSKRFQLCRTFFFFHNKFNSVRVSSSINWLQSPPDCSWSDRTVVHWINQRLVLSFASSSTLTVILVTMKRSRRHKHNRRNKKVDRLGNLPDCLLFHILSFLDIKLAVQTLILSKRWKNIWKCLSNLTLIPFTYFRNIDGFNKFVSQFLSLCDSSTSLHVLNCVRDDITNPHLLNRMVNYAVSHNVQQLHICVICDSWPFLPNVQYFPPTLFSWQTLTSLNLSIYSSPSFYATRTMLFPNSHDLPELISLSLKSFSFLADDDGCTEPFST